MRAISLSWSVLRLWLLSIALVGCQSPAEAPPASSSLRTLRTERASFRRGRMGGEVDGFLAGVVHAEDAVRHLLRPAAPADLALDAAVDPGILALQAAGAVDLLGLEGEVELLGSFSGGP